MLQPLHYQTTHCSIIITRLCKVIWEEAALQVAYWWIVVARWRQHAPQLIHRSLGPDESPAQKASWLVQPILQGWCMLHYPYTTLQWLPHLPQKLFLFGRYLCRNLILVPWTHPTHHRQWHLHWCSCSNRAHGRVQQTDQRTWKLHHYDCNDRPHLQYIANAVMWMYWLVVEISFSMSMVIFTFLHWW